MILSLFRIFLCALVVLFAGMRTGAAQDSVFTVADVKVDVTAESASAARDQAFIEAQQAAFRQLAERLLPEDELPSFVPPDISVLSGFVNDFEITEERLSSIRYVATYTFRFKDSAVRSFFADEGVVYSDVGSKPMLVLPFWRDGTRTVLWGADNPWMAAWGRAENTSGELVPVAVPIGDIQDVSDIGDDNPLSADRAKLAAMAGRYGAEETAIMIVSPVRGEDTVIAGIPGALTIDIYRTDRGTTEFASALKVEAESGEEAQSLFDRAVKKARKALQSDWKSRTAAAVPVSGESNSLQARVRFTSMNEWVETQKILRRVDGIGDIRLVSLRPGEAQVEILFRGGEDRLRLALAQSDVELTAPQVTFNDYQWGGPQASPLVYDLYLRKFGGGTVQELQ